MTFSKINVDKSIFISRNLTEDSILRSLEDEGFKIFDLSLLEFKGIPLTLVPCTEWLFFYSANAVKYFIEQCGNIDLSKFKIACLGVSSAQKWHKSIGEKPHFIGSGIPEEVCRDFKLVVQNENVTFLRAENSKRSIIDCLDCNHVQEIIIYQNKLKSTFEIPECKVLIFTSPMNVDAYLSKYRITNDQIIIAIGKTTSKSIPQNFNTHLPKSPNEASILKVLRKLT